jgi:TatD DNase family protein
MFIDSHCHLSCKDFDEDFDEVIQRAKENGVSAILNAGDNLNEVGEQLKISEKYPFIYTIAGVQPHNASEYPDLTADDIIEQTKHKKVVGIGECGLDFHYNYSPPDVQIKVFAEHIKAAQETGLPLVIHNRDSDDKMIEMLKKAYKEKPFTGEIHCFSSSKKLADFALSIGFYLSASGMITFNKGRDICSVFENAPMDRILIETDAPFLAPVPKRGRRNEPSFVVYTAEKLAGLRDMPVDKIGQITSDNFYNLFRKASDKGRYDYE